jgi:hypothetical protein
MYVRCHYVFLNVIMVEKLLIVNFVRTPPSIPRLAIDALQDAATTASAASTATTTAATTAGNSADRRGA